MLFRMRKHYPSLMTYIGIAAVIIAIPVKLVF
jgi:Tfp pilus assembly major pilin PilA